MRRRLSPRWLLAQTIALGFVLCGWLLLFLGRGESDSGEAFARPLASPPAQASAPGIASALPAPQSVTTAPPTPSASAPSGAPPTTDPIDLAIAPDGGVPFHPGTRTYRSPFARPTEGKAAKAKTALLLNSVDDYDVKTGTFNADFFLSLTSQGPMPSLSIASPNGSIDRREAIADTPTFKLFRFTGAFKSPPDLRSYPFDQQALKIILEDDHRGSDQIRFVVDKERTQVARGFRALGWQVDYVEARTLSQSYPDRFEGDDLYYNRYVFTLGLERYATSAAFKVFVPAFVIVLISLLGMWVPPQQMEVRSNAGAPMLAGAVLFHFALMQELPATSYLTRADKLMLGVYIALALGMISTWWMFVVDERHQMRVFRIARVIVPSLSVVVMACACLL